jgi:hypothetical protein
MSVFDINNELSVPKSDIISLQEELIEPPSKSSFSHCKDSFVKFNSNSDLSGTNSISSISPNINEANKSLFKKIVFNTIKNDDELTLQDKIIFSVYLKDNVKNMDANFIQEFNEEECHLSLLNWIWRYNKKFKQFQFVQQLSIKICENFETFFSQSNKLLIEINIIMELLINLLNFFAFLPINSSDILNLKLYDKLFKLKENIKSYANENVLNLIKSVLQKWKTEVDAESEMKIVSRFKLNQLGRKRTCKHDEKDDKEDTEAESVEDNLDNNNKNNLSNYLNKKPKNIKVSFDLQKNSVIYFKKDDIPLQISWDKSSLKDKNNHV